MRNRLLTFMTLAGLAASILQPILPAAVAQSPSWTWLSPDVDGDGLPNTNEQSGWCNAVGCFQTDPQNADSDNDGLTDGEEKLFDSNPNSDASPGIYVVYDDAFKTKQYYPWQQYGHKLIARGDTFTPPNPDAIDVQYGLGTNLDAVVIRRGTTFYVGGPQAQTLQIAKSIPALTTLTPVRDAYSGRWRISVPGNATVGQYTLQLGGKTLGLYVIFELPAPAGALSQAAIDRFLYDDNRADLRDEISILLDTKEYPPDPNGPPYVVPAGEEVTEGATYEFYNQQFNRYLFEGYVMPVINGKTLQKDAIDALVARVDQLTVFRNPHPRQNSWRVIYVDPLNPRQQCSNISGLLSAFSRSAGVPARPIMIDWREDTFDHADEIWLNGAWYAYRGYKMYEMDPEEVGDGHPDCSGNWPACGTNNYFTQTAWGKSHYDPWHSNGSGIAHVFVSGPEDWTETGRAYRWVTWDIHRILAYTTKIQTLHVPYWSFYGWTTEPLIYGAPTYWPALPGPEPIGLSATPGNMQVALSWTGVPTATSYNVYYRAGSSVDKVSGLIVTGFLSSTAVITPLTNGTQYAFAVAAVGATGESILSNKVTATPIAPPNPPSSVSAVAGDGQVTVSWSSVSGATSYNLYYQAGATVTKATGTLIAGATSPRLVTPLSNGQQYAFAVAAVGPGGEGNLSTIATATPLPSIPGSPANVTATPGDSQVTVSWNSVPGATSYNIYYQEGATVTMLTGTKLTDVTSPHNVTALTNGTQYAFGVTAQSPGGESALSAIATATPFFGGLLEPAGGSSAQSALPEVQLGDVTAEYGIDKDGDGRYDQLVLAVKVTVSQPGHYWLLGDLSPAKLAPNLKYTGGVIANAFLETDLAAGEQTVRLVFDGVSIGLSRVDGPYLLSRLRITDVEKPGPAEFATQSLDRRSNLYTTAAYSTKQFETYGALLTGQFKSTAADDDRDNRPDTLVVLTGIDVQQPGVYGVSASLFDAQGQFLSRATWAGSGPDVTLRFAGVAGALGPYTLRDINLTDALGRSIDSLEDDYPLAQNLALSDAGRISLGLRESMTGGGGILGTNITQTQVYTTSIVSGNLQLTAGVNVALAGSYALEAFLIDSAGNPIDWARSQPVSLGVGNQNLNLTFAGNVIRSHGVDGPYRVVALKVLSGAVNYSVLDKVNVALTTPAYARTQFNAPGSYTVFEDAMEAGGGQWTAGGAWNLDTVASFSASHAWYGSNGNSSLTTGALSLSQIAAPIGLRFHAARNLNAGEVGTVEVSTNGSNWTTVATFNTAAYWTTHYIDLSDYAYAPVFYMRFRLASSGGVSDDGWAIDDVLLTGQHDSDEDGLSDDQEAALGTDPNDPDSDNDGLIDGDEVNVYGTDPKKADTDDDGLNDYQEVIVYGTNPTNADTDGDGLSDGYEIAHGTDPKDADTDNDGLSDGQEVITYGTDPKKADTDNDGLNDYQEVIIYGTDPKKADTDNDGLTDGQEVNVYYTDPKDADSDDDGLNDGGEIAHGTDPHDRDTDNDGLTDGQEVNIYHTDPKKVDTDGDGYGDGEEVGAKTDPLDPNSYPRRIYIIFVKK